MIENSSLLEEINQDEQFEPPDGLSTPGSRADPCPSEEMQPILGK